MRLFFVIAFTLVGLIADLNQARAALMVEGGPHIYNGHTYYLLQAGSWTDSEDAAVSLGGHLVTINDALENQWILDNFNPISAASYLIGFTDTAQEGTFAWTSGEAVTFTNFEPGEPNDFGIGEDFVMLRQNGNWNDISNSPGNQGVLKGIVEIDAAVPEPASIALFGVGAIGLIGIRRRKRRQAI